MSQFSRTIAALLVLSALLAACIPLQSAAVVLRGSGNYQTRDYQIEGFTGITVCCGFRVTVTGGPAFKVSVTADDNILDAVSVRKDGSTLHIEIDTTKARSISSTRLDAAVTMPALQAVTLSGGSELDLAGEAPKVEALVLTASGGSRADVGGAASAKTTVTLSGGSHATVNATGSLDYDLSGGSQLRYKGNPVIGLSTASGGASAAPE